MQFLFESSNYIPVLKMYDIYNGKNAESKPDKVDYCHQR